MAVIYQSNTRAEAELQVHVSDSPGTADLWVVSVGNIGQAFGEEAWYLTGSRAQATTRIFLCPRSQAQLIVYFVNTLQEAGWRGKPKLLKSLGAISNKKKLIPSQELIRLARDEKLANRDISTEIKFELDQFRKNKAAAASEKNFLIPKTFAAFGEQLGLDAGFATLTGTEGSLGEGAGLMAFSPGVAAGFSSRLKEQRTLNGHDKKKGEGPLQSDTGGGRKEYMQEITTGQFKKTDMPFMGAAASAVLGVAGSGKSGVARIGRPEVPKEPVRTGIAKSLSSVFQIATAGQGAAFGASGAREKEGWIGGRDTSQKEAASTIKKTAGANFAARLQIAGRFSPSSRKAVVKTREQGPLSKE